MPRKLIKVCAIGRDNYYFKKESYVAINLASPIKYFTVRIKLKTNI